MPLTRSNLYNQEPLIEPLMPPSLQPLTGEGSGGSGTPFNVLIDCVTGNLLRDSGQILWTPAEIWTPSEIVSEGWWDAGGKSIVTEDTGGVDYTGDLSGNDQPLTQPTEAARPATGTHTLNGLNMFFFNGSEALATYGDDFVVPSSGNFSVFQVSEAFLPLSNVSEGMFSMLNAAGRDWQYVGGVNVNDWNGRIVVSELGGTNTNFSPPAGVGPSVYSVEFNFDASTINGYVSGNAVGGTTYTLKVTSPQTFITMSNRVGNALAGHWGECIIVEDVSAGTRQRIEGYLAWRWGLESQLPSWHPYKDAPPFIV